MTPTGAGGGVSAPEVEVDAAGVEAGDAANVEVEDDVALVEGADGVDEDEVDADGD
jgi:hypothetical protein